MSRLEYVYRNLGAAYCVVCGARACIELHVGTGGNYRVVWVCEEHDRQPDDYLLSGERRAQREAVSPHSETAA